MRRRLRVLALLGLGALGLYYPLVAGPGQQPGDAVHPLKMLETALRSEGIDALDLTDTFRAHAREDLSRGLYIYWRDDTHWNHLATELAAAEICAAEVCMIKIYAAEICAAKVRAAEVRCFIIIVPPFVPCTNPLP